MEAVYNWILMSTAGQTSDTFVAGMLLPVFSVVGVLLSTSLHSRTRFAGFCCGLISQPVWFYVAVSAYSLGMFINSMFFTALWLYRFLPACRGLRHGRHS